MDLSILDLAPVSEGSDAATSIRNSIRLAQAAEAQASIERLSIAGSPERLLEWLGEEGEESAVADVNVEYVAPSGTPGIVSVTFQTPRGDVTL